MRMAIPLLRDALTTPSSKTILETLEMTAKRGEGIVKQVLSFVRGMEGERSALKMKHLVNEISRFLRETVNPSIKIMTRCPADLWQVKGDATQLSQVLMNLSVNARDAMPDGGTLRVELQNLMLDEDGAARHLDAKPGPHVVLTVSDTGSGIAPENLSRIFDPFFTTKEVGKGTGLGLSTVTSIVKSHGGFIDLQSEVGRGTQFKVFLPATDVELSEQEFESQEVPSGHGETILVVEDEDSVSSLITTILTSRNYKVLRAADGTEGLALYMKHRDEVRLALVDMLMPVLDGASTVRALRKLQPDLKIVAMSGLLMEKTSDEIASLVKSVPFLSKPFDPEALLRILAAVLAAEETLVEAA
jgi:CheY-like chemotaxis protein